MFTKATFLGAFTLCMAATGPQLNDGSFSSFGDRTATDGAHPHQGGSGRPFADGQPWCGGAIVAKEWVITTADCVVTKSIESLRVVVGTASLSIGGDSYKVREVYSHEEYNSSNVQNNIAILKVEPLNFTKNVTFIYVDAFDVGGDISCVLRGWADTDKLQEIYLTTTTVEYCKNKQDQPIFETNICTKEAKFSCYSESGSPLTTEVSGVRRLIGIVAYGTSCTTELPVVYTRISSFVSWFQKKCNQCLK